MVRARVNVRYIQTGKDTLILNVAYQCESLKMKCEYIRQNPVVAGLVRSPEEYRWLMVDPEFEWGTDISRARAPAPHSQKTKEKANLISQIGLF